MIYREARQSVILPQTVKRALPSAVAAELDALSGPELSALEEIRLREGRRSEYVSAGGSRLGRYVPTREDMNRSFYELCERSVYAHAETVCKGYIRAPCGVRIGVCGRATEENGRVTAVRDISSLVIRLPHALLPDVSSLCEIFIASHGGMLLFSPPRVGKTTLLRAMAISLSGRYSRRTAVVDTRGELAPFFEGDGLRIDVLDGYPRGEGIEIALRALSPEVIICDEIGSESEASAILRSANCGVPVIASVHAEHASELVHKREIFSLIEANIFGKLVRLERGRGSKKCGWTVYEREELFGV